MKMSIVFCLLFLFIAHYGFCQVLHQQLPNQSWRIVPGESMLNPINADGDFNKSRIYISPDEIVTFIGYRDDQYGVALINSKLQIKWVIPIKGVPISIGWFHENLLILTTPEYVHNYYPTSIAGVVIDPQKGSVLLTKNLYTPAAGNYSSTYFFFIKNTKDFKLFVSEGKIPKGLLGVYLGRETGAIKAEVPNSPNGNKLITFSDKLDIVNTTPFYSDKPLFIMDITCNNEGELFTASFDGNDKIQIKKFDTSGTDVKGSFDVPIHAEKKTWFNAKLIVSKTNDETIYTGVDYTNEKGGDVSAIVKVDFEKKSIISDAMQIDEGKLIKLREEFRRKKSTGLGTDLSTVSILEYNGGLIVYRELLHRDLYTNINSTLPVNTIETGAGFVTIYNKDLQVTASQQIDKYLYHEQPQFTGSSSVYLAGNNFFILSANSDKNRKHVNFMFTQIDLSTNTVAKTTAISNDAADKDYREDNDPQSALWFPDGFAASYLIIDRKWGLMVKAASSTIQKYTFD